VSFSFYQTREYTSPQLASALTKLLGKETPVGWSPWSPASKRHPSWIVVMSKQSGEWKSVCSGPAYEFADEMPLFTLENPDPSDHFVATKLRARMLKWGVYMATGMKFMAIDKKDIPQ
jgi:hypothetical protein